MPIKDQSLPSDIFLPAFTRMHIKTKQLSSGMRTRIAQVAERRARNPEVRGSNPGSGSSFSLEIL